MYNSETDRQFIKTKAGEFYVVRVVYVDKGLLEFGKTFHVANFE